MSDGIRRFLIVDDQEDVTLFMMRILSAQGECACTNDPHEAVELFKRQLKNGCPFDAIFMDIVMPDMDGHETAEALRRIEADYSVPAGNEAKLVMISSLSDVRNVSKSFFKGGLADGYLTKPLSAEGVRAELKKLHLMD
jgi:two-component system chemotaxis response regulator CheY